MTTRKRGERIVDVAAAQDSFLAAFAQIGIITRACEMAGITRTTAYGWQEHDEAFALRYNQAKADADDAIRNEIHRRGVLGVDKPVYYKGKLVDTIKEYSDTLLIFLAKSRMMEFRDKVQLEHSGGVANEIHVHVDRADIRPPTIDG